MQHGGRIVTAGQTHQTDRRGSRCGRDEHRRRDAVAARHSRIGSRSDKGSLDQPADSSQASGSHGRNAPVRRSAQLDLHGRRRYATARESSPSQLCESREHKRRSHDRHAAQSRSTPRLTSLDANSLLSSRHDVGLERASRLRVARACRQRKWRARNVERTELEAGVGGSERRQRWRTACRQPWSSARGPTGHRQWCVAASPSRSLLGCVSSRALLADSPAPQFASALIPLSCHRQPLPEGQPDHQRRHPQRPVGVRRDPVRLPGRRDDGRALPQVRSKARWARG